MSFKSLHSGPQFPTIGNYSFAALQKAETHTVLNRILYSSILYDFIDLCDNPKEI